MSNTDQDHNYPHFIDGMRTAHILEAVELLYRKGVILLVPTGERAAVSTKFTVEDLLHTLQGPDIVRKGPSVWEDAS